jgi:hypothetical protein
MSRDYDREEETMAGTRRSLLKAAGAISALAALPLPAQTPTPTSPPSGPTPTATAKKEPGTFAKLAREKYGKFLTAEEQALMDDDMEFLERRSGRLRALKLENGEEPAVDFRAERS